VTGSNLTRQRDSIQGGRRRRGFTLVEMIVVMAIIGMLAAILIPTIRAAMIRARVSSIAVDLANLDAALNQFKEKYGDYPPDFSLVPGLSPAERTRLLTRFVQKAWPRITANEMRIVLAVTVYHPDWKVVPAEALVFWLSGFSEDPLHPFTGLGGPFPPFIDVNSDGLPDNPLQLERNQENALFPLGKDRLTESDITGPVTVTLSSGQTFTFVARESTDDAFLFGLANDPFPVCLTRGTNLPIVYLDAQNYGFSEYPMTAGDSTVVDGLAYHSDRKLLSGYFEFINPHSYQLITAGLDEDFGLDAPHDSDGNHRFKRYSSGFNYAPGDHDNITNFSGGTLEDAIP